MPEHRSRRRYVLAPQALCNDEYDVAVSRLPGFDGNGCWSHAKDPWTNPQSAAEPIRLLEGSESHCLTRLPQRTSRAFLTAA